ncbi:MAG: DegV family protein [Actinomycetota bacterium]|nr:DegV family protein [Actinomycetota bacterium]
MVHVVTDSAANLPADLAAELGVLVVPLHLTIGERVFRDGVDIGMQEFYEQLKQGEDVATTSAPSPGDFLEVFRGVPEGEDIVCVTVAAAVSATNLAARTAASQLDRPIEIVDSTNASMAEGFVAIEAARSARAGAPTEEVVHRAERVAARSRILATIDTFEFLRRSGRVRRAQAYAATMLNIKPVFEFKDGDAEGVARPRTRGRALERIVADTVKEAAGTGLHLAAFHALAEADAKELVRRVEAEVEVVESYVVEATPVVGAHTGPGLVGTAFFCD